MMNRVLWKRLAQASAATLAFLLLMAAAMAFASKGDGYIKAKKGGIIIIDDDTRLIIPHKALKDDTFITAKVVIKDKRVDFHFEPEGLVFEKHVYLQKSKAAMKKDALGYTLYYAPDEDNPDNYTETIHPKIDKENVEWTLEHFSLYYHRRR